LDAKTTLDIQQHLKSCAECARLFAEEEKLEARLKSALNQGTQTAMLWDRIERAVAGTTPDAPHLQHAVPGFKAPLIWGILFQLGQQLQAGWRRSSKVWSGLAATWVVILALNFTAREPEAPLVTRQQVPSASEMRFAVKQKQLWLAELAGVIEPVQADKPKPIRPGPRSDRRHENFNA
jgi:hypothetical protein